MAKYNKIYSSFYNGISEQSPELIHDTNCEDMLNCMPDIVKGTTKRPPAKYVNGEFGSRLPYIFHSYDRGEDDEEYLITASPTLYDDSLQVVGKDGNYYTVDLTDTDAVDYLTTDYPERLKAVTVQDTTFIINTDKEVGIETGIDADGTYVDAVIITLSGGEITGEGPPPGVSGAIRSEFSYTAKITLDGTLYTHTSDVATIYGHATASDILPIADDAFEYLINNVIPGDYNYRVGTIGDGSLTLFVDVGTDVEFPDIALTGSTLNVFHGTLVDNVDFIDGVQTTDETYKAFYWAKRGSNDDLNQFRYAVYLNGVTYEAVHHESDTAMELLNTAINTGGEFQSQVKGSILKISKNDGSDFTFSSWDSWGDQASFGWKSSVSKLSDLPQRLGWDGEIVEITGDDKNDFTDYFVESQESSWLETRSPTDYRGTLTNMPVSLVREADGTFTLNTLDWELPRVGDEDTNPTPSFVGSKLTDIFFYKNRLGVASEGNVVLSETAGYYNFYIKTVLNIIDTDPIDISIASNRSSKIHHVTPFQSSLFIFTQDAQYEMTSNGSTTPTTVSIDLVSSYPMSIPVRPVVSGDSLYFISISNSRQQLREYKKNNDTLNVVGIDLNLTTPTLMDIEITNILVNEVLGYIICATETTEVFVYSFKENNTERVQSAWSRWEFFQELHDLTDPYYYYIEYELFNTTIFQYNLLGNDVIITYATEGGS